MFNQKKIQKMAFIDPNGTNAKYVKKIISKVVDNLINKVSNAESYPPLLKKKKYLDNFNFNDLPISERELLKKTKLIINQSMNASNPYYLGHMDSLPTTMSIIGDIICSTINNNMLSKETAPVFTEIEEKVTGMLSEKFKLGEDSGGIMLGGGSLSNIQAIAIARNRILGSFDKGLMNLRRKPYIFASKEAHTSIKKAAMILGLGTQSVISIPTDSTGKMDIIFLNKCIKKKIKENGIPLCIVATAGTTISGSVDNLNEISKIAEKYKIWMHTDAVYAGALIFSDKYKNLLNGIEKSDSISFNPQKWLYITKTCSVLLLKNKKYLYSDFFTPLPYVAKDKNEYHPGELTIQGTRYPDILKLWLSLQHLGNFTYSKIIENSYRNTFLLKKNLEKINNIKFLCNPETNILCFRYVPSNINPIKHDKINLDLQKFLLNKNNIFFSYVSCNGFKWLRAVILNPFFNSRHINKICNVIESYFKKEKKLIKKVK